MAEKWLTVEIVGRGTPAALHYNFGPQWGPIVKYPKRESHLKRSSKCKARDETQKKGDGKKRAPTTQSSQKKGTIIIWD